MNGPYIHKYLKMFVKKLAYCCSDNGGPTVLHVPLTTLFKLLKEFWWHGYNYEFINV